MTKSNPILIGMIAGLVAAILMAGATYVSLFAVILTIAAIASLFIAALGSGLVASIAAVLIASVAMALLDNDSRTFAIAVVQLSPAIVMGYLANLARPASELGGPDSATAWFPLSDIMLTGAVISAVASSAVLLLHPDLDAFYTKLGEAVLQMMMQADPQIASTTTDLQIIGYLRIIFPLTQGAQMMVVLFGGFYFAVRILSMSGRSARPREDMPSTLRMNRLSIVVFLLGIAMMFASGPIKVIGANLTGAIAGGYLLAGYAIVHNLVRGKSYALPALIIVYLLSVIISPLAIVIALAGGLANPRRAIALTPTKTDQSTNPEN